jgi:hypothetical protein
MGKCYETYECVKILLMRNTASINKLKLTHSDPFVVNNIVNTSPLLKHYFDNEDNIIQKNTGPKVLKIDNNHDLLVPIIDTMQEKLLPFEVRYAHFFDVNMPHIIHNDDEFNLPQSYKAFTLPLKIYGNSNDVKLVIFDQYYYGGPAKFFNGQQKKENVYYNAPVTEYSQVHNCNTNGIKNTFKAEYLSHLKDKWTEGLSVNTTLDWAIGSVLCFDSLALHCSTDFTNKGIERKIGLSIFTICK